MKDCDNVGETVCSTEYESECVTTQERHEVNIINTGEILSATQSMRVSVLLLKRDMR